MVCRAYNKSPDEVRTWNYSDYQDSLEGLRDIPEISRSFYFSFCKSGKSEQPRQLVSGDAERKQIIEELKNRAERLMQERDG